MLRANAATLNMAGRLTLHLEDYRAVVLPPAKGPTLFLGNPPYVRHHEISAAWKGWMADVAASNGLKASKLAGLHIHFFLKTRELARTGDCGVFVTSAEWLDVNYGEVLRRLLTNGLGGASLHVIDAKAMPFPDAATTGAITCFRVGAQETRLRLRSVSALGRLGDLRAGRPVSWSRLDETGRWSSMLRSKPDRAASGRTTLGERCRVHRGQVTGCNAVWIAGDYRGALPEAVSVPAVTKARELIQAAPRLASVVGLRRVIDLPADLDELGADEHVQVRRFLEWARSRGADRSYVARHRRAWWAVALRDPAPHPLHLHGPPSAGVRAQPLRCPTPQHRARTLSARPAARPGSRRLVRLASGQRMRVFRAHLRGRAHEVRAEGTRTNPDSIIEAGT